MLQTALFLIVFCISHFLCTETKNVSISEPENIPVEEKAANYGIPQSITDILDSEPDNRIYQRIRTEIETYYSKNWNNWIGYAMESAFESDNDQLVIEMIKHYQYLPGWNSVDICDARNENIEIIQMLVDSGVNVDHYYHGGNAAFSASETVLAAFAEAADDPAILQLLIDHGSQINTEAYDPGGGFHQLSSVFNAARVGKAGNLRVLMENGGDIHRGQLFSGKTPLMAAIEIGSHECVDLLIAAGADILAVDYYGRTPLLTAVESGNEQFVRLLLDKGVEKSINFQTSWGYTAVMEAAIRGNAKILELLIQKGGNVHLTLTESHYYAHTDWYLYAAPKREIDGGQTALMMASTPECVKLLLQVGTDVNAVDAAGRNALLFQCFFYRNTESVSQLIDAGAYLYLDKDKGRNLVYLANAWSDYAFNSEIVDMLHEAGCIDENPSDDWDFYDYYFLPDRH